MRFLREAWKKLRRKMRQEPTIVEKGMVSKCKFAFSLATLNPATSSSQKQTPRPSLARIHRAIAASPPRNAGLHSKHCSPRCPPLSLQRHHRTFFGDVTCHTMLSHVTRDVFTVVWCCFVCGSQPQ